MTKLRAWWLLFVCVVQGFFGVAVLVWMVSLGFRWWLAVLIGIGALYRGWQSVKLELDMDHQMLFFNAKGSGSKSSPHPPAQPRPPDPA